MQVMSDGQVLEYDTPLALLKNRKSQFFAMVSKTGTEASRRLYQMAVEADRERKEAGNSRKVVEDNISTSRLLLVTRV